MFSADFMFLRQKSGMSVELLQESFEFIYWFNLKLLDNSVH
jgi:hypothetical protein